jgi:hypothetical protein
MSHELRTPLNSLLILAEQLEGQSRHNMTDTQVQYASVINASGKDLMSLLNSILDLAKVESGSDGGRARPSSRWVSCSALLSEFELVAQKKGLAYSIDIAPGSPETIVTDSQRLRQILKNLLANAFKFTVRGQVRLQVQIGVTDNGWSSETDPLVDASRRRFHSRPRYRHRHQTPSSSSASSRRSPRVTAPRRGSTEAPGSDCRSAANWPACSAGRSLVASAPGRREHLHRLPACR